MSLQGNLAVWAMQNRVETTFDEREFLEGAKDAWCAGTCLHATAREVGTSVSLFIAAALCSTLTW